MLTGSSPALPSSSSAPFNAAEAAGQTETTTETTNSRMAFIRKCVMSPQCRLPVSTAVTAGFIGLSVTAFSAFLDNTPGKMCSIYTANRNAPACALFVTGGTMTAAAAVFGVVGTVVYACSLVPSRDGSAASSSEQMSVADELPAAQP